MVFEYIHRISLFEVGCYLRSYLDDHATEPLSSAPMNYTLQTYLNFLVCIDSSEAHVLKRTLSRYLPPEKVDHLTDLLHDMILVEVRPYLNMDEGEQVVDVCVKPNYDATIVVHELDGAHAVLS